MYAINHPVRIIKITFMRSIACFMLHNHDHILSAKLKNRYCYTWHVEGLRTTDRSMPRLQRHYRRPPHRMYAKDSPVHVQINWIKMKLVSWLYVVPVLFGLLGVTTVLSAPTDFAGLPRRTAALIDARGGGANASRSKKGESSLSEQKLENKLNPFI